jgi:hypothetical protein
MNAEVGVQGYATKEAPNDIPELPQLADVVQLQQGHHGIAWRQLGAVEHIDGVKDTNGVEYLESIEEPCPTEVDRS